MKLPLVAIALGVISLTGATVPAIAQTMGQPGSPPPMARHHGGGMDALELTQGQRDEMQAIAEESHQAILSLLTDEQRAQLETLAQQRGTRPEPGSGGELAPPPEGTRPENGPRRGDRGGRRDIVSRLNLTDEQEASIREIRENAHDRMQTVLTTEQQQQLEQMRQNHPRRR